MKINIIFVIIILAIAGLTSYGFFAWNEAEPYQLLIAIGAGVTLFLPLGGLLALSSDRQGSVGNIRACSVIFLILEIISNIIFSLIPLIKPAAYVIVNGILFLVYILIVYVIIRALK
jgi:hypothetical protein